MATAPATRAHVHEIEPIQPLQVWRYRRHGYRRWQNWLVDTLTTGHLLAVFVWVIALAVSAASMISAMISLFQFEDAVLTFQWIMWFISSALVLWVSFEVARYHIYGEYIATAGSAIQQRNTDELQAWTTRQFDCSDHHGEAWVQFLMERSVFDFACELVEQYGSAAVHVEQRLEGRFLLTIDDEGRRTYWKYWIAPRYNLA